MPNKPATHRADRPRPRREGKRRYNRSDWKGKRARYLAKHPLCEARGCLRFAEEVDHKDGDNTNDRWSNYQALCKSCHSKKTVRENGGFGRPKIQEQERRKNDSVHVLQAEL
jgi:5-methylcytosine-specific restriction protein A